jgi:hypothetical protein
MNKLLIFAVALLISSIGASSQAGEKRSNRAHSEVQINEDYKTARQKMLSQGWKLDVEWGVSGVHEKLAFTEYPEVLCGEGYSAICTGRFKKGDAAVLLTIDQFKKRLPVTFISND